MAAMFLCSAKHGSVLHIVYCNPPPSQPIIIFKADEREEKSWCDKVNVQVTRRRKQAGLPFHQALQGLAEVAGIEIEVDGIVLQRDFGLEDVPHTGDD